MGSVRGNGAPGSRGRSAGLRAGHGQAAASSRGRSPGATVGSSMTWHWLRWLNDNDGPGWPGREPAAAPARAVRGRRPRAASRVLLQVGEEPSLRSGRSSMGCAAMRSGSARTSSRKRSVSRAFTDSGERSAEADIYAASLKRGEAPELARCHIRQNSLSAVLWANSFAGPRTASFGARRASPSSRWRR